MLESDPDVLSWKYEPMRLPYEFEGSTHNYVPDFLVTRGGSMQLVEVKPDGLLIEPKNIVKMEAATNWCESSGLDVSYVLVTEEHLLE